MSTRVQLEIFEGPLDLLLHLIKKNEVSITDIPIATITEQYLAALELMQSLNLDVAGEFLVMAATLVHIKSRMLLPAGEEEPDEEEGDDPREELVRRLLEYQRFKEAADQLERREILARDVFTRAAPPVEEVGPPGFRELSVIELVAALQRVLERLPKDAVHEVVLEKITVREKMTLLLDRLRREGRLLFESCFDAAASRMEVVVTFLAMLELVKMRVIRIFQEAIAAPILIEPAAQMEAAGEEERHGT
ncbi:MAG TPA: segregation/condensation protein A [candidate division Zixibacteria bacterium]|nr:segregation/condensation protein A [candidate division Zixibacteria bacterium]